MATNNPHHPAQQHVARLQPMPIWHDGIAYVAAAPQPTAPTGLVDPVKKPRPRKPYTATKTREMWTPEEHARMLEGLKRHKRDWAKVTKFVGTRSAAQVRSHAQKYFDRVQRDKTDDYVPQARPKRKSASPYPRKMRPDATPTITVQPQAASTPQYYQLPAQMPPIYGVPAGAFIAPGGSPQPFPYSMHPAAMFAPQGMVAQQLYQPQLHPRQVHHVQHPMSTHPQFVVAHPMVAPQAQQGGSVPSSPNISGKLPVTTAVTAPPGAAVYNPMPNGTIPPGAVPVARIIPSYVGHPSPQIGQMAAQAFPSPLSVDGRSYAIPPRSEEVVMLNNQPTMFAPHSPMTPAVPYGASSPSPMMHPSRTTMPQSPMPHMPTHSHPNGPDPNCAKCNALKRYGNVFQEMGAIHKANSKKPEARNGEKTNRELEKRNPGTPVTPEDVSPPTSGDDKQIEPVTKQDEPVKRTSSPRPTAPRPPKSPSPSAAQVSVLRIPKAYDASRPHHAVVNESVKPAVRASTGSLAKVLTTDREPKRPRDNECNVVPAVNVEDPAAKRLKKSNAAEQREIFDAVKSLQILGRSSSPEEGREPE